MNTTFNLQRFLDAQSRDYAQALREIKNGLKKAVGYNSNPTSIQ